MVALVCMDQSVGLGSLAYRSFRAEFQTFGAEEASPSVTVARSLQNGSSRPSFVPRKQQQQQPPPRVVVAAAAHSFCVAEGSPFWSGRENWV